MRILKAVIAPLAIVAFIAALQMRWSNVPPLLGFLNPTSGMWKNATPRTPARETVVTALKTQDTINVRYDEDMVPHIVARNAYDLYYAQGYVTARDRLWQMEVQVRKAEGRLSEIFGGATAAQDLYFRRLQLQPAAEKSLALMNGDCSIREMLTAYSDGVNAYIGQLDNSTLPVEYKLFGHQPRTWSPLNAVLIMKLMTETLAGGSDDFEMSQLLQQFGSKTTADLFPNYPYKEDPVMPAGTKWDFTAHLPPATNTNTAIAIPDAPEHAPRHEGIGSNNWALGSGKTSSGYPLLANDPHLKLTLPSIWYQVQLMEPAQNVYGVSMPGVPSVVIGFNSNIAWGVTNVYADVMDWYAIKFRDETCREYAYDGRWLPVREKIERIRIRGGGEITDTVLLTHYGPVFANKSQPADRTRYALKWIGHEPSQEIASFYYINHAGGYAQFRQALQYFTAPAQNFVYADKYKHIAMVSAGKYPLKLQEQGKYVLDGSNPDNEWRGWIPYEQNPAVLDPGRGFVSSANQSLTDQAYPYYINWKFSPSERARRINAQLSGMSDATADAQRLLQNDKFSIVAQDVLPLMLSSLPQASTPAQQQAITLLREWDMNITKSSGAATFFNAWWGNLYEAIWADEFSNSPQKPGRDRTVKLLLEESASPWFDDTRTPARETANDLIAQTFSYTLDSLVKNFGPAGKSWEWGRHKASVIEHIGKVGSFGTGFFGSEGSASTVDAQSRNSGPSWRMVVELGDQVRAYGILPGGQSGNPGSYYYDNSLAAWKAGKLRPLHFFRSAADAGVNSISLTIIKK